MGAGRNAHAYCPVRMGDIYALETPESVSVGLSVAGVGSRFVAGLLDVLILLAVLIAFGIVIAVSTAILGAGTTGGYIALALGTLVTSVVFFGYFVFFEIVWNGQTPGKRATGLRVIMASGYPVTPFAVLVRNVLRLVDALPGFYALGFYTVGIVTMLVDKRSRRLGDLAAGTMVIKEGREGGLSSLSAPSIPVGTPLGRGPWGDEGHAGYAGVGNGAAARQLAGAEVSLLTREDEALIRGFLERRGALEGARRAALAGQIAAVVHGHIGGDPPYAPEAYLEQALAARVAGNRS